MLANARSCFPLCVMVAFLLAASFPIAAQIHGVPPSVTSLGFGGSNNPAPGVPASVTSLGPNGFGPAQPFFGNCCGNFFFQPGFGRPAPFLPLRSDRRRHHHDDTTVILPLVVPTYVPYGVPYAGEGEEEAADEPDAYAFGPGATRRDDPRRPVRRDAATDPAASDPAPREAAQEPAKEPVAPQPSTILIFKDGHRSEVVNYAIVGKTLFDFTGGRTHKILLADLDILATERANDEQGVEFKIPPSSK